MRSVGFLFRRVAIAGLLVGFLGRPSLVWGAESPEGSHSGVWAKRIGPGDLSKILQGMPQRGGGASVANLLAVQFGYLDEDSFRGEPAGLLTLTWTNPALNIDGIQVFAEGFPLVDVDTGFPIILDGSATTLLVIAFAGAEGPTLFEVVGGNTTASDDIVILTHQPFDDPEGFTCEGGLRDPIDGTCSLDLKIPTRIPPDFYFVSIQSGPVLAETIPGTATEFSFPGGYQPGSYCVTLLGASSHDGNDYLGDSTTSCCDLVCKDLPCDAPQRLKACQNAFGPQNADNKVSLSWINGETYYGEVRPTLDGAPQPPLKGDATEMTLENLAPGEHQVTLEGDCGDKGVSAQASETFIVLTAPPAVSLVTDLNCRFLTPDGSRLVLSWKSNSPAAFYEVYIVDLEGNRRKVLTVSGQASSANLTGTTKTDNVGLKAFYETQGSCFSSDLFLCTPKPPPGFKHLLGDCDGDSNTNLTDSIFSLNYLFRGGEAPPCEASCDSNSDDRFNLADAVYVLNYLFLGGPPPQGKFPACDESRFDQNCGKNTCTR